MIARIKTLAATALVASALAGPALAAGEVEIPKQDWSFSGVFGTFDRASLQRGFQVYQNVCASCHALKHVAYRNLVQLGYNEDEIKAIAAEKEVRDGPNDEGEMFNRPAKPSDRFVSPFANDEAARASNGGALPPDLSLIVDARVGGANYLYAVLTGYKDAPADVKIPDGMYYNASFTGSQIAMPPPLFPDGVTYGDNTPATIAQQAKDVSTFLAWASEPNLEQSKRTGVMVILFLLVFTGLLYATKRKIWASVH
ncbi:Cytochrome c1, heme protein precursor [alpha proteobacterium BAL199]|jgi:ubiquinol-cytochrome c reductase cytochrome c1 subunit|nr:Cytochrome c1, heme protein precursor [alpha proteobacterium BAL199]